MARGAALQANSFIPPRTCCPTCGQTLPEDLPEGLHLSGYRRAIFEMVRKAGQHGVAADRIFDRLYSDRPDGGPDSGVKIVSIHVSHINHRIKKHGMRIKSSGGGHGVYGVYRLVHL